MRWNKGGGDKEPAPPFVDSSRLNQGFVAGAVLVSLPPGDRGPGSFNFDFGGGPSPPQPKVKAVSASTTAKVTKRFIRRFLDE